MHLFIPAQVAARPELQRVYALIEHEDAGVCCGCWRELAVQVGGARLGAQVLEPEVVVRLEQALQVGVLELGQRAAARHADGIQVRSSSATRPIATRR